MPRKTDRHSAAHDELAHRVETVLEGTVGRFADRITRVAVHLSDEHGHQGGGDDKRCRLVECPRIVSTDVSGFICKLWFLSLAQGA